MFSKWRKLQIILGALDFFIFLTLNLSIMLINVSITVWWTLKYQIQVLQNDIAFSSPYFSCQYTKNNNKKKYNKENNNNNNKYYYNQLWNQPLSTNQLFLFEQYVNSQQYVKFLKSKFNKSNKFLSTLCESNTNYWAYFSTKTNHFNLSAYQQNKNNQIN